MTDLTVFRCDDFDRALADYLSAPLSEHDALRVEMHASNCARCELLLDNATKRRITFAPPLPADVRRSVFQAISSAPVLTMVHDSASAAVTAPRSRAPGRVVLAMLAVAASLAVVVLASNRNGPVSPVGMSITAPETTATSARAPNSVLPQAPDIGFVLTATRVASAQAASEFAALDAALQELEAALSVAPDDRELRTFLASVRARRDELTRRVREVTS